MQLTKYDVATLPKENIRNDNFLQKMFLTWMYPVIRRGLKGDVTPDDLKMPADQATEVAQARFLRFWEEEVKLADNKDPNNKPSLFRAIRRSFGYDIMIASFWKVAWSMLVILGAAYFVRVLVLFTTSAAPGSYNIYNNNKMGTGVGWLLSFMFFLDSIFVGIALQRMGDCCVRTGIKVRAALIASVFQKTFRMTGTHHDDAGNVVSLASTDCAKLYEGVLHFQNVWTAPGEAVALVAILLGLTEGIYGLPALGILIFILPFQYYLGYRIAKYKAETVAVSDARVLRMHEVLLAIKLVKFYVWERSFSQQVSDVRDNEIKLLKKSAVIKIVNLCVVFAIPPLIALVIYATYVFKKGPFDSAFAFTVLSLFNTLRFPLVVLPRALRGTSEAAASIQRLEQFLLLKETDERETASVTEIAFDGATLRHPGAKDDFNLVLPKFASKPGEVVAIVGRVGCGKSSIFHAILNNMNLQAGTMSVGGLMAYVPQTPWVQNLSLRENILFGLPYDEAKYKAVIHACALELDLKILPKGDQSMAGERGINLSGGQRQRVCLARAAYHGCDICLLDNPLSAVDQHTARHIFDKCIKGLMKDKAVIWITHQLELLPECNRICIMENGKSVYFGAYNPEALNSHLPVDHLLFATVEAGESAAAPVPAAAAHGAAAGEEDEKDLPHLHKSADGPQRRSFQRSTAGALRPSDSVHDSLAALAAEEEKRSQDERSGSAQVSSHALGRVSEERKVKSTDLAALEQSPEEIAAQFNGIPKRLTAGQAFHKYFQAGGAVLGFVSIIFFGFTQTTRIISDTWIRWWAPDRFKFYPPNFRHLPLDQVHEGSVQYLLGYFGLVAFFVILLVTRDSVFSIWQIRGATKLHNHLFKRVLNAPMLFFLRTPVGDVLNAFTKDQDTLDETLPDTIRMSMIYLMILLTSLGIVTSSLYVYAALVGALILGFLVMQFIYLPCAMTLKRWAGDTAAMVFVHVDESLHGMDVIRAFDARNYFIQENIRRINVHHLAMFNTEECHIWLAFWCDLFGAIMVLATCLLSVAYRESVGPAAVGLAISNTIQVLVFFTWVVRGVADCVSMWDAVERITSFISNVPIEREVIPEEEQEQIENGQQQELAVAAKGRELVQVKVDKVITSEELANWPAKGDLIFSKVCLRYYPGAPLALKYVSFHIKDGEKIGVVGRTGSGKTTLLMALFRMFELSYGKIVIDGRNIASIPLSKVRVGIAIIPQEPVMFKGTVRSNLDPFNDTSDEDLWRALELVHLKEAIAEMPGGLDAMVAEGGSNFSLGQKQLVCMGRCVLKKTRILVLDEATAAMDLQTDQLIQKTIRSAFRERTTITIAHRLDTIIFSDRILAMAAGQLKEFDSPTRLLGKKTSMFNALVEDTGPHASRMLRAMAAEGPKDDVKA
uniref:ABC transporter n=2 Tax=Polytomella parva TaxID=51329 RepID=A0A7S0VCE4_9CHLO|mmetsp:Transcript_3529/g.6029  ORF Transcript_3529/g.6029 Transcript_3529/m.6029 type:complete len:1403 (+) Transcript_3529:112-4320(+)